MNMEHIEHRAQESTVSAPEGMNISYELKDSWGRVYSKGTTVELGDVPQEATEFDGYIETPAGNFAFQGPIKDARNLLKAATELVKWREAAERLDKDYSAALRAREQAAEYYRSRNDSSRLEKADEKLRHLGEELRRSRSEQKYFEEKLAKHRL